MEHNNIAFPQPVENRNAFQQNSSQFNPKKRSWSNPPDYEQQYQNYNIQNGSAMVSQNMMTNDQDFEPVYDTYHHNTISSDSVSTYNSLGDTRSIKRSRIDEVQSQFPGEVPSQQQLSSISISQQPPQQYRCISTSSIGLGMDMNIPMCSIPGRGEGVLDPYIKSRHS